MVARQCAGHSGVVTVPFQFIYDLALIEHVSRSVLDVALSFGEMSLDCRKFLNHENGLLLPLTHAAVPVRSGAETSRASLPGPWVRRTGKPYPTRS